jgi:hypothetical protein
MSTSEMTVDDAYRKLGVSNDTDIGSVTRAFRELSKKHHPDVSGSEVEQKYLNQAYEIVLDQHRSRALIPAEMKSMVSLLERNTTAQGAKRQVDELRAQVVRRKTRPIQIIKYIALIFAAAAGAFGWFGNEFLPLFFADPSSLPIQPKTVKIVALSLAGTAGFCQFLVIHRKYLIDTFTENLSDEDYCVQMLRRIHVPQKEFLLGELMRPPVQEEPAGSHDHDDDPPFRRLGHSIRGIAPRTQGIKRTPWPFFGIGQYDTVKITVLKALEQGILERPGGSKRLYRIVAEYRDQFDNS